MNKKYISLLQRVFFGVGIFILIAYVLALGGSVFQQLYFADKPQYLPQDGIRYWLYLQSLFRTIGEAFLAFLVSAVFGMVLYRRPVNLQRAKRLAAISCLGFVGEGLLAVPSKIVSFQRLAISDDWLRWVEVAIWGMNAVPGLIAFLYAGAIYVLFRHFSEMVTFESEVI